MANEPIDIVKPLLARIGALLAEINRLEQPAAGLKSKSFAPAPETAIANLEAKIGFRFPPSYRAFLKLHNGWKGFPYDAWVFGVSGPAWTRPCKDLKSYIAIFEKTFRRQGKD